MSSPGNEAAVVVRPLAAGASGLIEGIWLVEYKGAVLLRFDGKGAEDRAKAYAETVRVEVRAGTFGKKAPRGRCSFGNPCDRDRIHLPFLRDVPDAILFRVELCAPHREEARPATRRSPEAGSAPAGAPPGGPAGQTPVMGRRRKQPAPPPGGGS